MTIRTALILLPALLTVNCGAEPQERAEGEDKNAAAAAPALSPTAVPRPSAAPHTSPWSPSGYALNGAAPVWGGSLTGTTVRYMTPEDQFGDVVETRVAFASDAETYTGSWRGRPFVLTLRRSACSDGLSERTYPFVVELRAGGETRRGCADPQ